VKTLPVIDDPLIFPIQYFDAKSHLAVVPLPRRSFRKLPSKKSEKAVNTPANPAIARTAAFPRLHKKATSATPQTDTEISQEEIARLAYSFWEARGYQGGSPEQDWLRAEEELRGRTFAATA
jgi:hypothetical protein